VSQVLPLSDAAKAQEELRRVTREAIVLLVTGRTSDAIDEYKEALRINPDYAEAHNNLGNALVQTGRASEAIRPL
jgi:Flp pilus assembly protein TadD